MKLNQVANFVKTGFLPEMGSAFSSGPCRRGRHGGGCQAPLTRRIEPVSPPPCGSSGLSAPCSCGRLEGDPLQVAGDGVEVAGEVEEHLDGGENHLAAGEVHPGHSHGGLDGLCGAAEGGAVEIGHGSSRGMNLKNQADISSKLTPDVIRPIATAGALPLFARLLGFGL